MKKLVPFKKEIIFKSNLEEITSISLEHSLNIKDDNLISGEFIITGDYKMTDASINREKFDFKLPFDIALDSRYDSKKLIIDIDNFYYEIINSKVLEVNVEVSIDKLEEKLIEEIELIDEPRVVHYFEEEKTQKEIAKELCISRSYVSRIEKRALTKMLREFIKNKDKE